MHGGGPDGMLAVGHRGDGQVLGRVSRTGGGVLGFPDRPRAVGLEGQAVSHIIGESCIGTKDTACVEVCPVDCIHPTKDEPAYETAEQLYIDPDTCIDCGLCVDECPVKAIYPEEDLPAEWQKYVQINLDYYKGK